MSNSWFGVLDMAIVGIPVLSFCAYQLWSVNREIAKDKAAESAQGAGHPVGEHGLDDRGRETP